MSNPEPRIVWVSETEADRFCFDLVVSIIDKVLFFLNGKQIKEYNRKQFLRYNPSWNSLENTE